MKLDEYLKANKIQNEEFAKLIGVHKGSIPRYRQGKSVPTTTIIARIRKATGGQVDIEDVLPPPTE